MKDQSWNKVSLYFLHAYSLWDVDPKTWYAEIINPHDTVQKRYWIKVDDIARYFMSCTTTG